MPRLFKLIFVTICLTSSSLALADLSVPIYFVTGTQMGKQAGTILVSETPYGLLFTPDLHSLQPGIHGFHVHQNPLCTDEGMSAGGHLDPHHLNKHFGPYNNKGHLGDLPALYVTAEGKATLPVLAPRLKQLHEIQNHSLMLHTGGDNYADIPNKLGGGGARLLCGVVK